jgi:hypothetical protein
MKKTSGARKSPDDSGQREPGQSSRRDGRWLGLAGLLCLILITAVYWLRLDRVVGMFVDDAWYVLLAKALATGQGFTLINAPVPHLMPFYPPAFPALLSLVFRIAPDFPANLLLLKSVSIAAMIGVTLVTYWYFRYARDLPGYLSLSLAVATGLTPPLVFLATTTVMSEPVFMLWLLLAISVIEWGVRSTETRRLWICAFVGAFFASAAFLTRSIAIALILSVVIYLLKLRLFKAIAIFAAGVALFVGPWMIYARLHAPTLEQRRTQNGYIMQDYGTQFWERKAGDESSGIIRASELPERVWTNALQMITRDAGEAVGTKLFYIFQAAGGGEGGISALFAALAVAGFIAVARKRITLAEITVVLTVMIVVSWPFETFRFVLPLTPFLIYYVIIGLRLIYDLHLKFLQQPRREAWVGLTILVGMIAALHLYGHIDYILKKRSPLKADRPQLIASFEENEELLKWIKERLSSEAVIASENPALINLYTGYKTIAADNPSGNWATWNRLNVRYIARVNAYRVANASLAEIRYKTIYTSKGDLNLRVVDLGPPEIRRTWGDMRPREVDFIK